MDNKQTTLLRFKQHMMLGIGTGFSFCFIGACFEVLPTIIAYFRVPMVQGSPCAAAYEHILLLDLQHTCKKQNKEKMDLLVIRYFRYLGYLLL